MGDKKPVQGFYKQIEYVQMYEDLTFKNINIEQPKGPSEDKWNG